MSDPPIVPLGAILRPRNEIIHPSSLPRGSGRFVGLEHIESGTGRRIGELSIRLEDLTGRKARFHAGDIVYGYLRPYLNKVWLADFDGYCSVDQYVFEVDSDAADGAYVASFLRSGAFLSAAPTASNPGQLPRIRTEEVLSICLPLPELAAQRDAAANLSVRLAAAQVARSSSRERLVASRLLRDSIVEQTFSALADQPRVPLRDAGLLQDGDWILSGDYVPSGIRLLQVGDVGRGKLLAKSNRHISASRSRELKCTLLSPGDILISRMPDPIGRACVVPELGFEAITAVDVTIFRPHPGILDPEYAIHFMNSSGWLHAVAAKASGATRARISRLNLELLRVPVPGLEAQRLVAREIRERLAVMDAIEASLQIEREAMEALPAALLRRAFEGLAA